MCSEQNKDWTSSLFSIYHVTICVSVSFLSSLSLSLPVYREQHRQGLYMTELS